MKYKKQVLLSLAAVLGAFSAGIAQEVDTTAFEPMTWYSMEEAQEKAEKEGKKVLIFGYAEWCRYCQKMMKEVYPDTSVQNRIFDYYYPVRLNGESEEEVVFNGETWESRQLARYLRLNSYPTHYFVNEAGKVFLAQDGFLPADIFKPMVVYVGSDAYREMDFAKYMESKKSR